MMSFYDRFPNKKKAIKGIPGLEINRPLSPGVVLGDVGLELEIEGRQLPSADLLSSLRCPKTRGFWATHDDNSLRGENAEYVLSSPISIESVDMMVGGLYEKFATNKSNLLLSNRCSTHVHVNVSDWKIDKLTTFLLVWSLLEEGLLQWCGVERQKNHFALSMQDTPATISYWEGLLMKGLTHAERNLKYSALTVIHLFDYGSFEVRCGRAPNSAEEVTNWTKLIWGIREFVRKFEGLPSDVPALASERQASGILEAICEDMGIPEFAAEILRAAPDINREGMETFRHIQKLAYLPPWHDWKGLIDAEYVPNPFGRTPDRPAAPAPAPARLRNRNPTGLGVWIDPDRPRVDLNNALEQLATIRIDTNGRRVN